MTCAECLAMADAYVAAELPPDLSREVSSHVEGCASCRAEVEARRALREQLRRAFRRSDALAPDGDFVSSLRTSLRRESAGPVPRPRSRRWAALAAAAAALAAAVIYSLWRSPTEDPTVAWAQVAAHAAGDHRYCALQHALEEAPISLEEAARRYDPAYARLRDVIEASTPVREGQVEVIGAHACVFDRRRFAHVVLRRSGHVVSVLVTSSDRPPGRTTPVASCGIADGFQVACAATRRHLLFLVSDMSASDTRTLADALLNPVQGYLTTDHDHAGPTDEGMPAILARTAGAEWLVQPGVTRTH